MYAIAKGSLYVLSLLPIKALYLLSDFAYALLYYVFRYRRQVVDANLAIAFPEKSTAERAAIAKQFYKNFTDNFIETIKLLSGGYDFAAKHFEVDPTVMEEQFTRGHRVQFHMGHNFNWEMGNVAMGRKTSYTMLMVYLPVKSKVFERLMRTIRSSSGNRLLPATDMRNAMLPFRHSLYLLALIADQAPGDVARAYWLNFFGRPTPFLRGPERGAAMGKLAVIFGHIRKKGRGKYALSYELITEDASSLPRGELTVKYARYLENAMREQPESWLWSHRRWKREWKPEYRASWVDNSTPPA